MARLKRTSPVVEAARKRLSGLKGIDSPANLGANLTEAIYTTKIDSVSAKLDTYNQKIAELDQLQNELQQEEAELNDLNRRFLSAGEAVYGPDSSEYEMLGGTRKSERKKATKKSGGTG
jgi:vacuolar-type H+-ATPase subunit I/STV1